MLDSYRRLRHSFGFGVHSPFAFRFVRDVVRAPRSSRYYCHKELRLLLRRHPWQLHRTGRLIFRLAARMGFRHVCLSPGTDDSIENALRPAIGNADLRVDIPLHPSSGTLAVCRADELPPDFTVADWPSGCALVITRTSCAGKAVESIVSSLKGGWTFEGKHMSILVTDASQQLCRLSLLLP